MNNQAKRWLVGLGSALLLSTTVHAAEQKLFLFNWSQYMDPDIIKAFEQKYHVDVVQSYYGSLDEMYAKLQAGGDSQYDIIVPSNYFVPRLVKAGLVQPLNKAELPNLDNVMDRFKDPSYDPGEKYTAPYQWGITGIVYNAKVFPHAPDSWSLLFDPKENKGQPFSMISDGQVLFGAACAYLGKGYNCTGQQNWVDAAKLVLKTKQRSNFTGFIDGTPVLQQVARGVTQVGMTYNGDFLADKESNPEGFKDLEFMIPKEGAEVWVDSMMIPRRAPHPKLAHEFINFILNPKIGAQLSNYNMYSTPNKASVQYLDPLLRKPPALPTPEQMKRLEFTPSLDGKQLQLFQQIWSDVKSR